MVVLSLDCAGASMYSSPSRLRSELLESAHLERCRSGNERSYCLAYANGLDDTDAYDLDGRAAASARVRRAYMAGLLDGSLGRRHSDCYNHPSKARIYSPQRSCTERKSHRGRALHSKRKHPHMDHYRYRSCLSDRTVHQKPELRAESGIPHADLSVHRGN